MIEVIVLLCGGLLLSVWLVLIIVILLISWAKGCEIEDDDYPNS